MYLEFCYFILVFFFYSFIGYLMEVISVSLNEDTIVFSRGYLIGPYLPIFGFGAIFMIEYLEKYQNDIIALFILGMVTCCTLEYFTSLLMEKIFSLRWWDYSDKKYNVNGRVCLENGIYFGLGAILLIRYFHPWVIHVLMSWSSLMIIVIGSIIFLLLLGDFIISTHLIIQLKIDVNHFASRDSTKTVRDEMKKKLLEHSILRKRILNAYPRLRENTHMIKIQDIFEKNKKK